LYRSTTEECTSSLLSFTAKSFPEPLKITVNKKPVKALYAKENIQKFLGWGTRSRRGVSRLLRTKT
jgi:hypothetical protein